MPTWTACANRSRSRAPSTGSSTAQLRQKLGDYFDEGKLICEVEDDDALEVVIALDEQLAARVGAGQRVRLKSRSLPFDVFDVGVQRVAPRAAKGDVQSKVNVYCRLDEADGCLRSGMTGLARLKCGHAPIDVALAETLLRLVRAEFGW
ncbi:MAG: HlyD family efflux transporter periplasmic adaptor subunit [Planctomycetales bacterium]|nr:HlyD family efflux transporter periplasmic adaptor subunit [Planctomycetales bacterium]